jgi:hypothetical protein
MAYTHHLHYRTLYRESLDDLIGLCGPCHAYVHGRRATDPCRCPIDAELRKLIYDL